MPKRAHDQARPLTITPHYLTHPEGSCLIEMGDTKVICTASIDERLPPWLAGKGRGWVTAEYDMLPRATDSRRQRDSHKGKPQGRTQEISRLIGRALRAAVDLTALGERGITIDCDVIQADGGTRTAAITGGYVALVQAIQNHPILRKVADKILKHSICAISVGIVDGQPYLDLDYALDSNAHVDLNVVMTSTGGLVEVQGTGESGPFDRESFNGLLDLALSAYPHLSRTQQAAIDLPLQNPLASVSG